MTGVQTCALPIYGYSFKGGMDYQVAENSTLSFSGGIGNFSFGRGGTTRIESYSLPGTARLYEITSSGFEMSHDYYNLNLDFQNKFNDEGHQLDA